MDTQSQARGRSGRKARASGRAAQFEAEAAYADSIFRTATGDLKGAVAALRRALEFDPEYAPAIFSLGTVEYQRGKHAEGRRLFHVLLSQPVDAVDVCDIVDHAGEFLIGRQAYKDGLDLYQAAALRFPHIAVFQQGVGYCAGHEGLHEEAIAASRRACELQPENQRFASDLGWSLLEAGRLSDAEATLTRAVAMDPADELARENLRLCKTKLTEVSRAAATPNSALEPTARVTSRARRGSARGR